MNVYPERPDDQVNENNESQTRLNLHRTKAFSDSSGGSSVMYRSMKLAAITYLLNTAPEKASQLAWNDEKYEPLRFSKIAYRVGILVAFQRLDKQKCASARPA